MLNDEDKCEQCAKKEEKSAQTPTSSTGTTPEQRR
jgi:hypothetical protein